METFPMFKIRLWYDNEDFEENIGNNIGMRCINCVKTTGLSEKNTNLERHGH